MAIFGRSFPFPRRYVGQLSQSLQTATWTSAGVGAATWVGVPLLQGKVVQPHRLPDRPRPKLGVFIGRPLLSTQNSVLSSAGTGAASFVGLAAVQQKIVHVVRLPDRPRPKLGVFIGRAQLSLQTTTWSAAGIGAASWISNAIVPVTQSIVRPHRLADRPRPKLGVFIGHARLSLQQSAWTSVGVGAAAWTGATTNAGVWSAAGVGAASWVSPTFATGVWSAAGVGAAAWITIPVSFPATYYMLEDHWINDHYLQAGTYQTTVDLGGVLPLNWVPTPNVDPVDANAIAAYKAVGYTLRGLSRTQFTQLPIRPPNYVWQLVNGQYVLVKVGSFV